MPPSHPVFVVGAPRTGTTLVREILNRHPRIHLFDEVHYFERLWDDREALGDLSDPASRRTAIDRVLRIVHDFGSDQALLETMGPAELESRAERAGGGHAGLFRALLESGAERQGADIWGDSSPHDVLYLSTLFRWYPNAKVIALLRDPRAFLSSYKNYHRRGISSYRERYNPVTNSILWRSSMNAVLEAPRQPWGASVLRVRYEDLVTDPETWVARMCAHIGVEYDARMLEVGRSNSSFVTEGETTSQRGIVTTSTDRWKKELSPTEIWVAERITGPWMDAFGYERAHRGAGLAAVTRGAGSHRFAPSRAALQSSVPLAQTVSHCESETRARESPPPFGAARAPAGRARLRRAHRVLGPGRRSDARATASAAGGFRERGLLR